MSRPPLDSIEITRRLLQLTQRQCQILYWVCHGKTFKEVGERIGGYGQDLVTKEMSVIYRLFDLTPLERREKRKFLEEVICPLHETLMANPGTDSTKRPPETVEPEPDPDIQLQVQADAAGGLIPLTPTPPLIGIDPGYVDPPPPPPNGGGKILLIPTSKSPRGPDLLWFLIGILSTLLVVALGVIIFLATRQPSPAATAVSFHSSEPTPTLLPQSTPTIPPPLVLQPTVPPAPTRPPTQSLPAATATQSDQQQPPPGKILPAGEGFTKGGTTITFGKSITIGDNYISFSIFVENQTGRQLPILYRNSFMHLRDDTGRTYGSYFQSKSDWNDTKQFIIPSGQKQEMDSAYSWYSLVGRFDCFAVKLDPSVKYLVFTLDQLAGMSNMNWKYDILP